MISSDDRSANILSNWKMEGTILRASVDVGALHFSGRGHLVVFTDEAIALSFAVAKGPLWELGINFEPNTPTSMSSLEDEDEPAGSVRVDIISGEIKCALTESSPKQEGLSIPKFG